MPDGLLNALRFVVIALLYLFFVRVLWAVAAELRGPRPAQANPASPANPALSHQPTAAPPADTAPAELVVYEPPERRGQRFAIVGEITIGRAGGCQIHLPEDSYVSQLHARVFSHDGALFVEDLDSTNGTFVDGQRLEGTVAVDRGVSIQIGRTLLEVT